MEYAKFKKRKKCPCKLNSNFKAKNKNGLLDHVEGENTDGNDYDDTDDNDDDDDNEDDDGDDDSDDADDDEDGDDYDDANSDDHDASDDNDLIVDHVEGKNTDGAGSLLAAASVEPVDHAVTNWCETVFEMASFGGRAFF